MSVDIIRSAQEAPRLVSPKEGQASEVLDTEEAMRVALLAILSNVEPVEPENQMPAEAPEVEAGIRRLVQLAKAA